MTDKPNLINRLLDIFSKQEGLEDLLSMSESRDGYKRENAVRRLGMLGNPLAIPELLIRANDWVKQVRQAAKEAIYKLTTPENAEAFVVSLPELYHLRDCGRDRHEELVTEIERYLLRDENTKHLINGILNENALVARACLSLVIANKLVEPAELIRIGLSSTDVVVRAKVSHLLGSLESVEQDNVLDVAIKDTFMPIRREAFQLLLRRDNDIELAQRFLFDRHTSIREIAMRFLQHQGMDISALYRNALESNSAFKMRCAIWGLGVLGASDSLNRIQTLASSPYPSVRKQSLTTLIKLLGAEAECYLIDGLADPSPAVCKESVRLLNKLGIHFGADRLLEVVRSCYNESNLACCVRGIKMASKWERLLFLLSLPDNHGKGSESKVIEDAVQDWSQTFNKSASQPMTGQIQRLRQLIDSNKSLSQKVLAEVSFSLSSYE